MGKPSKSENVQVILRLRPLNKKELAAGHHSVVNPDIANGCVYVAEAGVDGRAWGFDAVYTNAFTQRDVYNQSIRPLVNSVIAGFNGTIFAYGQSGTGKTYSMSGDMSSKEAYGITPNAVDHIFTHINETKSPKIEYQVKATYVELYQGKCRDLLVDGQLNLELKENAQKLFYVKDLSEHEIESTEHAMQLMEEGLKRREVKSTELNADSSRSHSLFTLIVKVWDKEQDLRTESKLNLVDLAGSERQSKTGATGETLKEGNAINLSLTALGTVIDCLVKQKPHVPYRSTQLTMLLKDGLGGNSRTVIVGAVGPSNHNAHETVSTLRFIDRARQIKNKPKVQMDPKDARIAELMELVKKLQRQLGIESGDEGGGEGGSEEAEEGVKKKKPMLLDDEIERLRQRIEELELELQTARNASESLEHAQRELDTKAAQLDKIYAEKENKLVSEISDLKDRLSLRSDSDDDKFASLLALCTSFLKDVDTQGEWSSTLTPEDQPTLADIEKGFGLLRRGVTLPAQASPTLAQPMASASPTKAPRPPADAKSQGGASFVRTTSPAVAPLSDEEFPQKDRKGKDPSKKEKKDKKEKRSKRDKEGPGDSNDVAVDVPLPDAVIDAAINKFPGLDAERRAEVRELVDSLLSQQRAGMREGLRQSEQRQEGSLASSDETAELLSAMQQLRDEVSALKQGSRKQQAAVEKARAMADKKITEVTTLKEHIDSLREELSSKHTQHAAEMALHEERLIQQFNKKTDQLIAKQAKDQKKERKARTVLEKKIEELEDRNSEVERQYDTKVMEYETLLRDFEDAKFEQMKRFRNTLSSGSDDRVSSRGNIPVPITLGKIPASQSNVAFRLAELPDKTGRSSAPELPALGAMRRPPSGTGAITRSPLDKPRSYL